MYRIKVEGQGNAGVPDIDADFGRVTVILGANGAGKSRLLEWIKNNANQAFGGMRPVIYIEGGRVAQIPPNLHLDHREVNFHRTAESSLKQHRTKRLQSLSTRIKDALVTHYNRGLEERGTHSDAVTAWMAAGKNGPAPERQEPPLLRLARLFSGALPLLTFEFENPTLRIKKGARKYGAESMSDGERQTLAILADVGLLAETNCLIVVDEPELNMSALLASSLWSSIEAEYPEAVFVYATHSIPFSMRDSVDKIIVLSATGAAAEISDPTAMDESELRPFLGAMPNILRSDRVLLVEGLKNSFDSDFYRWITKGRPVEIVPVGDCNAVEAASAKAGIWEKTPKGPLIRGIIDRDYRSDDIIKLRHADCDVLGLHEAESYLCDPRLLHALASALKIVDPIPSEADFLATVIAFAEKRVSRVAAKRTSNRLSIRVAPSVANSAIDRIDDEETILGLLKDAAMVETKKANEFLAGAAIDTVYKRECAAIRQAIMNRNVRDLLRLFPGKELLSELGKLTGLRGSQGIMTAVRGQLQPDAFEFTRELHDSFPAGWL
jgi:ABC-type cobalamin/Fe3+-siderophores transport system ATPase subunit